MFLIRNQMGQFAAILFVVYFLGCTEAVRVRSCSRNPANDLATVNFVDVRPDPVQVPGDLSLAVTVTMNKPIKGRMDAELKISRRFGPIWIDLPCINTAAFGKVGSCQYPDICNNIMSNRTRSRCPSLLANNKIPCQCNVPAGKYVVPQTVIPLNPSRFGINLPTVAGEYQAILRVTDRETMREVYCLDVTVELVDPPSSSPLGSIGRFFSNLFG